MPMNVPQLKRDAILGNYSGVKAQFAQWLEEGRPDPGQSEWLTGRDRGAVAAALCQVAAKHGLRGVIESLSEWSDPVVRAGVIEPRIGTRHTPAQVAAQLGHAHIIQELAGAGKDALNSLVQQHDDDGYTPAQRATFEGHAAVIEALANVGGSALASLAEIGAQGFTPAQMAAERGCVEVMKALVDTQDDAVLASLFEPDPTDGYTPQAWARLKHRDALEMGDVEGAARYAATADVLRDAWAMKEACADLEKQPPGSAADRLVDALYCPVSFLPLATEGPRRPVHLKGEGEEIIPQQCVSAKSAQELSNGRLANPLTRRPFATTVEAVDRATLVRAVMDAYMLHPSDWPAARGVALNAHEAYERKVVTASESAARGIKTLEEDVAWQGIATDGSTQWAAILKREAAVQASRSVLGGAAVNAAAGGRVAAALGPAGAVGP